MCIRDRYEILDIKSDGTGTGQISRVGYDVFYEGNKIGDVSSLEDGIGQALRIDFGTASIDAVQALVRNLTYTDTFVIRSSGQRSLSLIIQDSDGLNTSYTINVSVNDHPDRPATGPPVVVNNKLTIENGALKSIASNNIKFADADNVAADLTITVSAVTHGQFEYIANGGVTITTFTQEDINNGLIQFVHDASGIIPSYQLTATDPSSNVFGPNLAAINFSNGSVDNLSIYENKIGVGIISNANITGSATYSITGGADSSSFTINSSSGSLTFITAPDYETDAHSYVVEVTVIGSSTGTDVRTVNVLLQDINESPTISGTNPTNTLDPSTPDSYSFTPVATDPENAALTFSITNKPAWASFNVSTGELTITDPSNTIAAADTGSYSDIQITVNDGINSASLAAFFINVVNNNAPVANAQTGVLTNEDTATAITLGATDADSDPLTYTLVSTPTNGALTGTAPNVTYTPNANYFGSDSFSFKVNDGAADSNTAAITITVADINDLPTVSSQSVSTPEDNALAIVLAATDSDGSIVSYTANSPTHGLLTGVAPNLTYTPDVNFSGSDSFTFTATDDDSGDSLPTTVNITVTNVNDAPVIAGTPVTTIAEDTAYSFTATATDDDGDTLVFSITGAPSWLNINSATGVISGTPTNSDVGTTSNLVVTVTDPSNASDSLTTFAITVTNVNDAPVIAGTPVLEVRALASFGFTPTATDDDAGDTLTFSIANKPVWAILDTLTGQLSGIPAVTQVGDYAGIVISVTDSQNESADLLGFTIRVSTAADTDGDGVPDVKEQEEGTDPTDPEDKKDTDGDGVPDYIEERDGTDATDPTDIKDTDGDSVPDYIEERDGTDPTDPEDKKDTDGDGVPDYIEAVSYTHLRAHET